MAQVTDKMKPLKTVGAVRPFDTVTVTWADNVDSSKNGTTEDIHPELARKLAQAGKLTYEGMPEVAKPAKKGSKKEEDLV